MANTSPRPTSLESWVLTEKKEPRVTGQQAINIRVTPPRVKLKDVAWMADNLATTQGAGVPLYRALSRLASMRPGTPIADRLLDIQAQMGEGSSMGAAMRKHEKDFGPLVVALVEAGEASGSLERSFLRIRDLSEARLRLQRKVRGALVYPVSVVVVATILIAALMLFVVPRFEDIYSSLGSELPAMTRALIAVSGYAPGISIGLAVLVLVGFLVLRRSRTDENLRRRIDEVKLRIPLTGPLVRKGVNARIASTLSSLLAAGVPLLETLRYSASTAGNLVYADAMERVRERVTEGSTLSEALEKDALLIPPLFIELSTTGEETGDLAGLMDRYAKSSEEEVAKAAEGLTSMIEPLTMVLIGGVVGSFLIGLYLPIVQIGDQIR